MLLGGGGELALWSGFKQAETRGYRTPPTQTGHSGSFNSDSVNCSYGTEAHYHASIAGQLGGVPEPS